MNSKELSKSIGNDRQGYDPKTETYHEQHDWDCENELTYSIVTAVSTVTGDAPADIEPLYEVADPRALYSFFSSLKASGGQHWSTVEITFNERTVVVCSNGEICVQCEPADEPPRV